MDNTKLPAYPLPIAINEKGEIFDTTDYGKSNAGFTKLELASLMIAQGMFANGWAMDRSDHFSTAVHAAKRILEEANK